MKFITVLILTVLLGYLVYLFNDLLPWWTIAIAAFIAGAVVPLKAFPAWLAGFLGVALLWLALAWMINDANGGIMAGRMAQVLPLNGNVNLLYVLTALVGGLTGGFGALAGHYLRKPLR